MCANESQNIVILLNKYIKSKKSSACCAEYCSEVLMMRICVMHENKFSFWYTQMFCKDVILSSVV